MRATEFTTEVNVGGPWLQDELTVKESIIDYFLKRGYKMLGEGRDQIAFQSPRHTVVKVVGFGDKARMLAVEHYVKFFEQNQNNPYYPKIYSSQHFKHDGETYFVYETEYLDYVSNDDDTLDWLERYLNHLGVNKQDADEWLEQMGVPDDIPDVKGLTQATIHLVNNLARPKGYMMDLSNIENIRRRADGHLVLVDPISI